MRFHLIDQLMEEEQLDAVILAAAENVCYLTGYSNPVQKVRPNDLVTYFVKVREEKPVLITGGAGVGLTAELMSDIKVSLFSPFPIQKIREPASLKDRVLLSMIENDCFQTEAEAVKNALGKIRLLRVGVDNTCMSWNAYHTIQSSTDAELVNIQERMEAFRKIKDEAEVILLRHAAQITEKAFIHTFRELKEGMTELDVQMIYHKNVILHGGSLFFSIIGFDGNGAYPNWTPGIRELKKGTVIRFDIGCQYKNYCADIARTVYFGDEPEHTQKVYDGVKAGFEAAIDLIRPGVKACDLFHKATEIIRNAGIPEFNRLHCGHGIGLNLYEGVHIKPQDSQVLQPGMVFCLETPYYVHGEGGYQVENMIHVVNGGCEVLNTISHDLYIK